MDLCTLRRIFSKFGIHMVYFKGFDTLNKIYEYLFIHHAKFIRIMDLIISRIICVFQFLKLLINLGFKLETELLRFTSFAIIFREEYNTRINTNKHQSQLHESSQIHQKTIYVLVIYIHIV